MEKIQAVDTKKIRYINYTSADDYNNWVSSVKKKKRKNKQYASKVHKNNNSI